MRFLVKIFPEVTIKSTSLRKRFIKQLRRNLQNSFSNFESKVKVLGFWDHLIVYVEEDSAANMDEIGEVLSQTPGIAYWLYGQKYPFSTCEDVLAKVILHFAKTLEGNSFCVRCKRSGKHDFTSVDVEKFIGAGLLDKITTSHVQLKNPDVLIRLEIKSDWYFIVCRQGQGLGGYPLGTQGAVLSLISGGFDSSVASYMMIRRGLLTHFCFFNLGGKAHEAVVKELTYFLWKKYSNTHNLKLVVVSFEEVISEILYKVRDSQMGVLLKRMMLHVASKISNELNARALVTGEVIGQVSSQTLDNLSIIDQVSDKVVLRPLIAMNKQDIINLSREIGTARFVNEVPEYCAAISQNPTASADLQYICKMEEEVFTRMADTVAAKRVIIPICDGIASKNMDKELIIVEIVSPSDNDIIVDVRHPYEVGMVSLEKTIDVRVKNIPYYRLSLEFPQLDHSKRYLLYCSKNVMSRLQAVYLYKEGYKNVGVFTPELEK